jgi:hypothetical protein
LNGKKSLRNVREVYGIRSRYIHHQKSVSEESAFEQFFQFANACLFTALANMRSFSTALNFISAIDRVKFGGYPHLSR